MKPIRYILAALVLPGVFSVLLLVGAGAATNSVPAGILPPTPAEMGLEPPEFPPGVIVITNQIIKYIEPEYVTVKLQVKRDLGSTNWTDVAVYKVWQKEGFFRVVIE